MTDIKNIEERIQLALSEVRPYLQIDEGDVEFVRFEEESGTAEVRFLGMCRNCSMSIMTLRAGIERFILKYCPEVRRIEAVN